jgi:hypothetical protein
MLAGGADISTASKLLGCVDFDHTDVYAHLIAAIGQRAVDGAAALILPRVAHSQGLLTRVAHKGCSQGLLTHDGVNG